MKMTLTELRARVNQMFKEQVVPEYATRELAERYRFIMHCIDGWAEDCVENFDEEILKDAEWAIDREYTSMLNPSTAVVGEGATVCYWSDRHAYTIIGKSKTGKKLTLRQCKATLDPSFKPKFIEGGFAGHCTNQEDQEYIYEEDPEGEVRTANWSNKWKGYYSNGLHVIMGRYEFYDYNF